MSRAIKIANETINNLNAKIAELLPKATAYDAVMETFDSVSYRDFCNKIRDTFGVKENEVRNYLVEQHLIYFTYKGQQMLIDYFAPTVALDNPV